MSWSPSHSVHVRQGQGQGRDHGRGQSQGDGFKTKETCQMRTWLRPTSQHRCQQAGARTEHALEGGLGCWSNRARLERRRQVLHPHPTPYTHAHANPRPRLQTCAHACAYTRARTRDCVRSDTVPTDPCTAGLQIRSELTRTVVRLFDVNEGTSVSQLSERRRPTGVKLTLMLAIVGPSEPRPGLPLVPG